MTQKFHVKCINNGKEFEMPNWTPKKHERALAKLHKAQKENKWTDEEAASEFKYYIIHETGKELDPDCDWEAVKALHPGTVLDLYHEVYNAGKEDIYVRPDFQKGRKTRKSKK